MKKLLSIPFYTGIISVLILMHANAQIPLPFKHERISSNFKQSLENTIHNQNNFKKSQTKSAKAICWQKTIGGTGDEFAQDIIKLADGNFLTCGATNSQDGNFNAAKGGYDAFVMKIDAAGHILWKKTYGGSNDDAFYNMVETSSGDLYVIGSTTSNDGQVSGNHGGDAYGDVWPVKINRTGNLLSQHCYGGSGDEYALGLTITADNKIVFAGSTSSSDGDVSNNHGDFDGWIVKLEPGGAIDFSTTIGYIADDEFYSVAEINGDILATGTTSTKNAGDPDIEKYYDAIVVRLDQSANVIYYRKYGGTGSDDCNNMIAVSDGNAVLVGHTASSDGDVPNNNGFNMWILKIDVAHNGDIIWQNFIGVESDTAAAFNITQTRDGGFIVAGGIAPNIGEPFYTWDAYAAKVNGNGKIIWTKQFGGNDFDIITGLVEANNKSILITGATSSNDADLNSNHGGPEDAWLINLGKCSGHSFDTNDHTENIAPVNNTRQLSLNNFPNPFFQATTVSFNLSQAQKTSLSIYDKNGKLIKVLANAYVQAGIHQISWDAKDQKGNEVSIGIYYLKFETENYSVTKKLSVIK